VLASCVCTIRIISQRRGWPARDRAYRIIPTTCITQERRGYGEDFDRHSRTRLAGNQHPSADEKDLEKLNDGFGSA
jgi:hypothetical protein